MDAEIEDEVKRVFCGCNGTDEENIQSLREAPKKKLNPLLFHMIRCRSLPLLKFFIELGADVDASSKAGMTLLHYACQCGEVEMAQYLVKSGALRLTRCDRGFNLITYAVLSLSLSMVKWACKQGCDLNNRDINGLSVLHAAVAQPDQVEKEAEICAILEYLIDEGALIDTETYPTPAQLAEAGNLHEAAEVLKAHGGI